LPGLILKGGRPKRDWVFLGEGSLCAKEPGFGKGMVPIGWFQTPKKRVRGYLKTLKNL